MNRVCENLGAAGVCCGLWVSACGFGSMEGTAGSGPSKDGAIGDGAKGPGYYVPTDLGTAPVEPAPDGPGYHPFVVAEHDPLSTFAADVDTASYDGFRRSIGRGVLPSPETVRVEEYVNYFAYEYPLVAHDAKVPFAINVAAAPHLLDRGTTLMRIGIQGKSAPPAHEEHEGTNLVFLVDTSGSMASADKLPLVQRVLSEALTVLQPTDSVSIVTYASGAKVVLPPTAVSENATLTSAIDSLEAGGSTAGGAGLELAYEQAESAFVEGGLNHVVLCTDGDFNIGPSSTEELVRLIEDRRTTGITLTALGFGWDNLNDSMMEEVSNAGNGIYALITDEDQATRYANQRLLSAMTHIAKDVKIQVEFNPALVYAYRLIGYDNRSLADGDFRDDVVDAGEIGAGHQVTALYELALERAELPQLESAPALAAGEPFDGDVEVAAGDLALVKVRYKGVDAAATDLAKEVRVSLAPEALAKSVAGLDRDFRWAAAIATFAEILRDSPYVEPSALAEVDAIVMAEQSDDPDRSEFGQLWPAARRLFE